MTTPSIRQDNTVTIEVLWLGEGDVLMITAVNGQVSIEGLQQMEKDLVENEDESLTKGPGTYLFEADHDSGQYDEYGRCEFPPGWGFNLIEHNSKRLTDGEPSPSSAESEHICDGCGSMGWAANCDKCIPY